MKAMKLFGKQDLRMVDCAIPSIGEDEVLLRVKAAALCGSDLRMIANGYASVSEDHPLILGHEVAGVIEAVGKRVQCYTAGMRVAVAPNMGCGVCDACVQGNTQLCAAYQAFGIQLDGGFAEYMAVAAPAVAQGNLTILPDNVSFAEATLIEPLSCVLNGQELVRIEPGDTVIIIGAGPIGIMHAMLAKMRGAARVIVSDLNPRRLALCHTIDPQIILAQADELQEEIRKQTHGNGAEVCIVACPSPQAQADALQYMAMNGRILYFGGLPAGKDQVTLATNIIHYKQLTVCGSTRASISQYRKTAAFIFDRLVDVKPLLSKGYYLDDFAQALQDARQGEGLKYYIQF